MLEFVPDPVVCVLRRVYDGHAGARDWLGSADAVTRVTLSTPRMSTAKRAECSIGQCVREDNPAPLGVSSRVYKLCPAKSYFHPSPI